MFFIFALSIFTFNWYERFPLFTFGLTILFQCLHQRKYRIINLISTALFKTLFVFSDLWIIKHKNTYNYVTDKAVTNVLECGNSEAHSISATELSQ